MRISFEQLKRCPALATTELDAGNTVELTYHGRLWAVLCPASIPLAAGPFAKPVVVEPLPSAAAPVPVRHVGRKTERETFTLAMHGHTGDAATDLAEMETRRRKTTLSWPPARFVGTKRNEQSWAWEEWSRLRTMLGLPTPDNMPASAPPVPGEPAPKPDLRSAFPIYAPPTKPDRW